MRLYKFKYVVHRIIKYEAGFVTTACGLTIDRWFGSFTRNDLECEACKPLVYKPKPRPKAKVWPCKRCQKLQGTCNQCAFDALPRYPDEELEIPKDLRNKQLEEEASSRPLYRDWLIADKGPRVGGGVWNIRKAPRMD